MDDILDSVHTVQEAQELTTGIDIVLEKGGFKVKEWQSNKDLSNNCDRQDGEINVLTGSVEDKVLGVVSNIAEDSFKFKVKNEAIRNSELNQADKEKYPQSSSANVWPRWIRFSLPDTSKDWLTRVVATRIWMGRRPSFRSSTKMDRLFQGNERPKQGLLSKKLTSQESIYQLSVFSLTHPKELLVHARIWMDGCLYLKIKINRSPRELPAIKGSPEYKLNKIHYNFMRNTNTKI